jgi:vitamin B12 transporter
MIAVLFLASAATAEPELVVTAAREPISLDATGSAVTVIETDTLQALDLPQLVDALRLSPGLAIARSGPVGTQTQVRLRGAESNHALVFVDGIPVSDPASSGDFRWETLSSAGVERVEVLRGPQSALWGSEAVGGVVSVVTREPTSGAALFGDAETGSFGTVAASGGVNLGSDTAGAVLQSSWFDTDGIDSIASGPRELDGFESFALSFKGAAHPATGGALGLVARYSSALSEFDGTDPVTFRRADTLDATRIRSLALRGFGRAEALGGRWMHELSGTYLATDNINRNAGDFLNRTDAETFGAAYQSSIAFTAGTVEQRLTAAAEYREQHFRARDRAFFGLTNQNQTRERLGLVLDYGAMAGPVSVGASLRRDENDSFADTTTWRVSGRYTLTPAWSLHASAGTGVADPTFTEQFGFFPGSFVGNPDLRPERSTGWDAGISYGGNGFNADVTVFSADLRHELLTTFDPATFLSGAANASGESRRRGIETSLEARPEPWLRLLGSYTYLDSREGQVAGAVRVREVRRPRHAGNLAAIAAVGRGEVAFSANYVGPRRDSDFDSFPARDVTLGDYVLASLSGRVPIGKSLDLTGRIENLFDARYEDVFGYRTQGLSAYAGVRFRWGG